MSLYDKLQRDIADHAEFHWHTSGLLRELYASLHPTPPSDLSITLPFELLYRRAMARAPRTVITQADWELGWRVSETPQIPRDLWFDLDIHAAAPYQAALTIHTNEMFGVTLDHGLLMVLLFAPNDAFNVHMVTLTGQTLTPANLSGETPATNAWHKLSARLSGQAQEQQTVLRLVNVLLRKMHELQPDLHLN